MHLIPLRPLFNAIGKFKTTKESRHGPASRSTKHSAIRPLQDVLASLWSCSEGLQQVADWTAPAQSVIRRKGIGAVRGDGRQPELFPLQVLRFAAASALRNNDASLPRQENCFLTPVPVPRPQDSPPAAAASRAQRSAHRLLRCPGYLNLGATPYKSKRNFPAAHKPSYTSCQSCRKPPPWRACQRRGAFRPGAFPYIEAGTERRA